MSAAKPRWVKLKFGRKSIFSGLVQWRLMMPSVGWAATVAPLGRTHGKWFFHGAYGPKNTVNTPTTLVVAKAEALEWARSEDWKHTEAPARADVLRRIRRGIKDHQVGLLQEELRAGSRR